MTKMNNLEKMLDIFDSLRREGVCGRYLRMYAQPIPRDNIDISIKFNGIDGEMIYIDNEGIQLTIENDRHGVIECLSRFEKTVKKYLSGHATYEFPIVTMVGWWVVVQTENKPIFRRFITRHLIISDSSNTTPPLISPCRVWSTRPLPKMCFVIGNFREMELDLDNQSTFLDNIVLFQRELDNTDGIFWIPGHPEDRSRFWDEKYFTIMERG